MIKFSATLLATLIAASVNAATVDLRIMETTDLHSNMMDFDYYKDAATEKFGLVRTATLIERPARKSKTACWSITAMLFREVRWVTTWPPKGSTAVMSTRYIRQ